jgi:hypothetical protein
MLRSTFIVLFLIVFGCSNNTEPTSTQKVLTEVQILKASNPNYGDQFGAGGTLLGDAVVISADGSTLAVGATFEASNSISNQEDNSFYGAGAVYVFTNQSGNWIQEAYLKPSNPGITDNFGYAIEISDDGDTLVVSSVFEASSQTGINPDIEDEILPQAGAVYVFTRNAGNWSEEAYIKAPNTGHMPDDPMALSDGDQFGFAVSINGAGNKLAIAAITEDSGATAVNGDMSDNSTVSAGAVYIYEKSESGWEFSDYLKASNAGGGDLFGYSVSFSQDGNTLAIGGYDEDGSLNGNNDVQDDDVNGMGAVYVFEDQADGWIQTAYLKGSYQERNDSIGVVVDISADGRTLVSAALDEDSMMTGVNPVPEPDWESDLSTGGVYVFIKGDNGQWSQQAYIKASNTGIQDWFGSRLELSPNGDELIVGAQLEDSDSHGIEGDQSNDNAQEAGAAYLFTRENGEWTQQYYFKGSNTETYDEFASTLSTNFDGSVIAIGARGEDSSLAEDGSIQPGDNSLLESGAVYIFTYN